jgi:putative ABC transport system permease protein
MNALRMTRRHPGFVTLVLVTLATGIGAATAAVNVATSVLWTPLPVTDEGRVLVINKTLTTGSVLVPFSPDEMKNWSAATRTMAGVAGVQYDGAWPWPAQFGDAAMSLTGTMVSGNFFTVLGAQPIAGRLLVAEDANPGSEDVVVIGYRVWRRQFAGDPGVVGQKIRLNGRAATIVGVASAGFDFPKGAEAWQPLVITPAEDTEGWFSLVTRLKAEATAAQATQESAELLRRFPAKSAASLPQGLRTAVVPLKEAIVGDTRPVLRLFVAAALLLLVVAAINVMNLLLVRGTARQRELATCAALGATPRRLIAQLLRENAVFAVAAGVLGACVAFWLQRLLVFAAPPRLPRLDQIAFDSRTLAVGFAATLLAGVIAGLAPAFWTGSRALSRRLNAGSSRGSWGTARQSGSQMLIASQLAFALLVMIGAGLLLKSLQRLQAADLGFSIERLHVVEVPLVAPLYGNPERRLRFFDELVTKLEALPGIAAATPVLLRPFTGSAGWDATFTREGQGPHDVSANPGLHLEAVLPNYFSTMGVPIVAGRAFAAADRTGAPPVAIVSQSLARNTWPGSSAIGKRLKFGGFDSPAPWMTVVAMVADARYRDLEAPRPAIYVPLAQSPFPARFLLVRTAALDTPVLSIAQRAVKEIDRAEPVPGAASVAALLGGELAGPTFNMIALGVFAFVTLLLASVGVFGVLNAYVAQRSRELGLRVALGANLTDLRGLVLSRIGWPLALGLGLGIGAALAAAAWIRPLLFDVSAWDAAVFSASCIGLAIATGLAAIVPLRRAGRIDPVALLRSE